MPNFTTLAELREMAHVWNETLTDDVVQSSDLSYISPFDIAYTQPSKNGQGLFDAVSEKIAVRAQLNERAFEQLCGRVDVPSGWAVDDERCPPELRQQIMDWKFANGQPKDWMIRLRDHQDRLTARAILSDQYTPYDHFTFVEALSEAVSHAGIDVLVWRPEIGDHFRAWLLVKGIDFGQGQEGHRWAGLPPGGDRGGNGGLLPALYARNSEVGDGKVRITGGLYRSWCENGAIIGWQEEDSLSVIHRFGLKARQHMSMKVNEAIAVGLRMSEKAALAFLDAQAVELNPTKIGDIINDWAGKYGITVNAKDLWTKNCDADIMEHGRLTVFDLINEASYAASKIENPDMRETMEIMAGDMIFVNVPVEYRRPPNFAR